MSAETVQAIIQRAVAEPEFRGLLFRDPPQALAGYELSETETAALCGLTADSFDGSAAEVEARLSHSIVGIGSPQSGTGVVWGD